MKDGIRITALAQNTFLAGYFSNREQLIQTDKKHRAIVLLLVLACNALFTTSIALAEGTLEEAMKLADQLPKWYMEEVTRESDIDKETTVRLGDDYTLPVIGELIDQPEFDSVDGSWYFSFNYGSDGFIECFVVPDGLYPFHAVNDILGSIVDSVTAEGYGIGSHVVLEASVRFVGGAPVGAIEHFYLLTSEANDSALYTVKGRATLHQNTVLYCVNVETGFRQTFDRIFDNMVTGLHRKTDNAKPYYRELLSVVLNENIVGFSNINLTLSEDGGTEITDGTSMLFRTDASNLLLNETYRHQRSTPEGDLISAEYNKINNGEVDASLKLASDKAGKWLVNGKLQGKEVEYDLGNVTSPKSLLGQHQQVIGMLKDTETSTYTLQSWLASADPSTFMDIRLTVKSRETDNNSVVVVTGPLTMNSIVDDNGSTQSVEVDVGPMKMNLFRKQIEGAIK